MDTPKECQQPAYHEMHLCILQHISAEEVKRLSGKPEYRCRRCSLQADLGKNLCQPTNL